MYELVQDSDEEIEDDEDGKVTDVEGLLCSVTQSEGPPPSCKAVVQSYGSNYIHMQC